MGNTIPFPPPLLSLLLNISPLLGALQELLDSPNPNSPAQSDAYMIFTQVRGMRAAVIGLLVLIWSSMPPSNWFITVQNVPEYKKRVKAQALQYPPPA